MKKLSTTQDLLFHDMNQGHSIFNRYWKSSSLPPRERHINRPRLGYRRDKVLSRLLNLEMQAAVERVSGYSGEMIANACKELGIANPHTA
ncbi:DUF7301 family protein [Rosenbergiella nectarea]|uniref:DUF7301 family protein n=1 Tax=Rosenbergiella nectarea TaxID=988801 RepID=UPI001F4E9406|nr:hypothetical protein [Rosenbergiella nectarea]